MIGAPIGGWVRGGNTHGETKDSSRNRDVDIRRI